MDSIQIRHGFDMGSVTSIWILYKFYMDSMWFLYKFNMNFLLRKFINPYISSLLNDGFLNRVKVQNYQEKHTYTYLTQNGSACFGREHDNLCKFGSQKKEIILLGDSQLASIAFDLHARTKLNYTFVPITRPGYFHLRDVRLLNKNTRN